jgi:hypothetical protein
MRLLIRIGLAFLFVTQLSSLGLAQFAVGLQMIRTIGLVRP